MSVGLESIHSTITRWAERTPDALALLQPGHPPMTYERLATQIERTATALADLGARQEDRVAIALPQGPEMVAVVLSVSACAAAAPLNPDLNAAEYAAALSRLGASAVIVAGGTDSPAALAATTGGWPVVELRPLPNGVVGEFSLSGGRFGGEFRPEVEVSPGLALLLSTSGTTSRPRWVPLTHRNVMAAAENTRAALGLTAEDRCLNVMPLFHGHGLVAGVLAQILAGGSVVCTPGFDAVRFFGWLAETRPTWFTAVPTMHEAIVAEAPRHRSIIARGELRFIRSASAPLPSPLQSRIEEVFGVLVTESYGLSEALQLTNTPLDSRTRRVGSLGVSGSSEVAIMDEAGRTLGPDEPGEIVCRGPVVMTGYYNDQDSTAQSFRGSWFKTGDLGFLDRAGHLHMIGRLKETINRGGEKIFPMEVDEALMAHPSVAEAATFGLPDPALGEEVAVAVVLRAGVTATAADIREIAAARLSAFKVPRRVFIVPSIPLGPTGKVQRRELPARLGLLDSSGARPLVTACGPALRPRDIVESQLARIWESVLGVPGLGVDADFFDLGGTSLAAARLMEDIGTTYGVHLHPSILFSASTVQRLARRLEADLPDPRERPLTAIQRAGRRRPFVFLHGHYIGGGVYCRKLARGLDHQQPFFTFSPFSIAGAGQPTTIEGVADAYLETLREAYPVGPYFLGGYSHAGLIAFEMARRLVAAGEVVPLLAIVDVPVEPPPERAGTRELLGRWARRAKRLAALARRGPGPVLAFASAKIADRLRRPADHAEPAIGGIEPRRAAERAAAHRAIRGMIEVYVPGPYTGPVTLFTSTEGRAARTDDPTLGWRWIAPALRVIRLPGDHTTCVTEHGEVLGRHLQACLDEAGA